jgi:kumamolisin
MPDQKQSSAPIPDPDTYQPIKGSERHPSSHARLLEPADPNETFLVSILLRRRPDGPPPPDPACFLPTSMRQQHRMSNDEFAAQYGASPLEMEKVAEFVKREGMKVVETNLARRILVASGAVAQVNKAFAVTLGYYEHENGHDGEYGKVESDRERDGSIYVPKELSDVIVGVFGLDNRRITKHNCGNLFCTAPLSVPQVRQLYNFPTNSAAGQTIGIFCGHAEQGNGYDINDIKQYFHGLPATYPMPAITDISVHGKNSGSDPYGEITQDICIAGAAAPGAAIAVYFTTQTEQGWIDCINRVVHPDDGDPVCNVLSISFFVADRDDIVGVEDQDVADSWITAVHEAFQDAAIQGITVCIASGDTGADSKIGDGKAHVQYPASDPWVLAVGGTAISRIRGSPFFYEYVWNDDLGATGGGVSAMFAQPSYQFRTGVRSLNNGKLGRGVPDVAANASGHSGYSGIVVKGKDFIGNGTSAAAPLWAGLIAVLNAAIGENLGFVNPELYAIGSRGFRNVAGLPGRANNSFDQVPGYPAHSGWDACTGWGSPNGTALLADLVHLQLLLTLLKAA